MCDSYSNKAHNLPVCLHVFDRPRLVYWQMTLHRVAGKVGPGSTFFAEPPNDFAGVLHVGIPAVPTHWSQ